MRRILKICMFSFLAVCCSKKMSGPSNAIVARFRMNSGQPFYSVSFHGRTVLSASSLGIVVDADTLGAESTLRGVRKTVMPDASSLYEFVMDENGRRYSVQFRLFKDGIAFRYVLGSGNCHIDAELTSFSVPAGVPVWFFERPGSWKLKSYAGEWKKTVSDSLCSISPNGPVQGAVLLYELPQGGYMSLTEAALYRYSGMRYRAREDASLVADFTEGDRGFDIWADPRTGLVTSPWRVLILADDLNSLVNSKIIYELNPDPDPELFPSGTDWIKPGRCVWSWWSDPEEYMTPRLERRFIDAARTLGYEYTLLDEGWESWPDKWKTLSDICSYASEKDVRVLTWKHSREISDTSGNYCAMDLFLDSLKMAGVAGIKVDFMNSEEAWAISFDEALLAGCAARRMVVDFHGCQKPSGESRTYPNELTREGVRGLELNRMNQPIPGSHDVALVFTRGILGNMDYTPVGYSRPAGTTYAHQTATAFAYTSHLTVVAEHVDTLLHCPSTAPALPLLKALPTVWDETCVLHGSSISELALLARRSGDDWYLVALGGMSASELNVPLQFLGKGTWTFRGICDPDAGKEANPHMMKTISGKVSSADSISLKLMAEGGAVLQFKKEQTNSI